MVNGITYILDHTNVSKLESSHHNVGIQSKKQQYSKQHGEKDSQDGSKKAHNGVIDKKEKGTPIEKVPAHVHV